jgi:hypothetical protein
MFLFVVLMPVLSKNICNMVPRLKDGQHCRTAAVISILLHCALRMLLGLLDPPAKMVTSASSWRKHESQVVSGCHWVDFGKAFSIDM